MGGAAGSPRQVSQSRARRAAGTALRRRREGLRERRRAGARAWQHPHPQAALQHLRRHRARHDPVAHQRRHAADRRRVQRYPRAVDRGRYLPAPSTACGASAGQRLDPPEGLDRTPTRSAHQASRTPRVTVPRPARRRDRPPPAPRRHGLDSSPARQASRPRPAARPGPPPHRAYPHSPAGRGGGCPATTAPPMLSGRHTRQPQFSSSRGTKQSAPRLLPGNCYPTKARPSARSIPSRARAPRISAFHPLHVPCIPRLGRASRARDPRKGAERGGIGGEGGCTLATAPKFPGRFPQIPRSGARNVREINSL